MKGELMSGKSSIHEENEITTIMQVRNGSADSVTAAKSKCDAHVQSDGRQITASEQMVGTTGGKFKLHPAALVAVAAVASGLLMSACFFPLSWGLLAWFALAPLLLLVRTKVHPAWVYICAYISGVVFFGLSLSWMPAANHLMQWAWYGLTVYCAVYVLAAIWLLRLTDKRTRLSFALTVPVVWVGLEYLRSFCLTGFAWYFLGHTQHIFLPMIQLADLGGAYMISFLVAMVNGLLAEWLYASSAVREAFRLKEPASRFASYRLHFHLKWQSGVAVTIILGTLAYGYYRLSEKTQTNGPILALLQGNIDQNIRNSATPDQQPSADEQRKQYRQALKLIGEEYTPLCQYAASTGSEVDLIVWPETSFPGHWLATKKGLHPDDLPALWAENKVAAYHAMRELATVWCRTNVLVGLHTVYLADKNTKKWYNSALLMNSNGTTGGRYDKIHRLPFGEYVPMSDWSLMRKFAPYQALYYRIEAGREFTRFQIGDYKFGVLICFEDTDPALARQYGVLHKDGPPVDFLVNISNDGWFVGTSEHNEHLAIARFRAVETRRSLARAVNMGISAVIDSNGKVLQPTLVGTDQRKKDHYWAVMPQDGVVGNLPVAQWNQFKKRSGVLTAMVPLDCRTSLYSQWGDWFAGICFALVALLIAVGVCLLLSVLWLKVIAKGAKWLLTESP